MPDSLSSWDKLSTATAQVLFCDLQHALVNHSETVKPQALSSAAGALLQLAKLFSLPTLISVVPEGNGRPQLIDELKQEDGFAPEMLRTTVSLFGDPATLRAIERSGRKVLLVAGFMLEAVVVHTILDARARGYEVLVAVDACGARSLRTEQAVLRQMESAGAVPTSVISIGTRLSPDLATDTGKQMFAIVQRIRTG